MVSTAMVVTALLYSGIPNPSWPVPDGRTEQVSRAIAGMSRIDDACPPQGGLGYSGVRLDVTDARGGEQTWTFAGGFALMGDDCFRDAGRGIERLLLETGRGRLDAELVDTILR
jgi:hypothetical protein